MTSFTLTIASAEVRPLKSTVSLRTMLSSFKPSKSNVRLKVPVETVGATRTVGTGVGSTVGAATTGVGTGVAVGTGVGDGGSGVAVGVAVGTGVDVGVAGTGV